jgi:hypothetical protein
VRACIAVFCLTALVSSGCRISVGPTPPRSSSSNQVKAGPGAYYLVGGALVVGGAALGFYDMTHDTGGSGTINVDGLLGVIGVIMIVAGVATIVRTAATTSSAPPPGPPPPAYQPGPPPGPTYGQPPAPSGPPGGM